MINCCRYFYLFIASVFLSTTVFGQQEINKDSLAIKKATMAFSMAFKNADSAIIVANDALSEATQSNNKVGIANAYNSIGWAFMHKGHLDSSIIFIQKAKDIFTTAKSDYDITRVDLNLAEVYTKQYKINEATRCLIQADSLSEKINSVPLLTDVKRQLAIVYRELGDNEKAAGYFKEALDGFAKLDDYIKYINTGVSLSILYRNINQPDSSLAILEKCAAIAKEKSTTPYQLAMIAEHTGETYFIMNKFNDALTNYTNAYNRFTKLNNSADIAFEEFCVGKTLSKLNRYKEAENYLTKAWLLCDTLKMINYQVDISYELAGVYEKSGNWQMAYNYLKKFSQLKDTINVTEQLEKTNELKEKFETEKKEHEINLLTTKNKLSETDNKRSRLVQYIFIILFAASLIIGGLLFNRGKIKRKLQEQVLRNHLAGDLHDDIGSALSSIDISSRIALVKKDDAALVESHLQKIREQAKHTMESMSDIVWSISADNDSFENLLTRIREFAVEICEPQDITLQFDVSGQFENLSLTPDKRKNLFLIFKEAINNAAKYSQCTSLVITFKKADRGSFVISLKDDGIGFDLDNFKPGNGVKNMKNRAKQMGADFSVYSTPGKGTTIELFFTV
ncbi:MAG: tetratricopeptide repeat protein [Ginsengibacter sp.]